MATHAVDAGMPFRPQAGRTSLVRTTRPRPQPVGTAARTPSRRPRSSGVLHAIAGGGAAHAYLIPERKLWLPRAPPAPLCIQMAALDRHIMPVTWQGPFRCRERFFTQELTAPTPAVVAQARMLPRGACFSVCPPDCAFSSPGIWLSQSRQRCLGHQRSCLPRPAYIFGTKAYNIPC